MLVSAAASSRTCDWCSGLNTRLRSPYCCVRCQAAAAKRRKLPGPLKHKDKTIKQLLRQLGAEGWDRKEIALALGVTPSQLTNAYHTGVGMTLKMMETAHSLLGALPPSLADEWHDKVMEDVECLDDDWS